tara:strand:+ start:1233 stop:1424 length:192 start_codon:yes stop_codon:yes gene_type:complete
MEYAELKLYSLQGGDSFQKKNINPVGQKMDSNDRKILRVYKKKIIEQRDEIKQLKERIKELEK